jgi:hypothetical protein
MSATETEAAALPIETWDVPTPPAGALPVETDTEDTAAAAGPRKTRKELTAEVEALRAEVARLRAGEEPVDPHDPMTTGGHLLWVLGHATPEMREQLASLLVRSMTAAQMCAELNHANTVTFLRDRLELTSRAVKHAKEEAARLDRTSGPEGRAVAMALTYALLPAAN